MTGPRGTDLWAGWLLAPLAWFVQLELTYALVPFVCGGPARLALWLVAVVTLAAAAAGTLLAWRATRVPDAAGFQRFLAVAGVGLSLLFAVAIVATAVPTFVLRGCD